MTKTSMSFAGAGLSLALALGLAAPATAEVRVGDLQEDRTAIVRVSDNRLEDRIEDRIERDKRLKQRDIDVDVDDSGVVRLQGSVPTAAERARAERLARVKGVSRVDNEINVERGQTRDLVDIDEQGAKRSAEEAGDKIKRSTRELGEEITDSWITTKVKAQFVGEDVLDGNDVRVETEGHVVVLRGTVPSESARERAVEIARTTKGVVRVEDKLVVAKKR
jgi:osmotically-inducible protein OsmY